MSTTSESFLVGLVGDGTVRSLYRISSEAGEAVPLMATSPRVPGEPSTRPPYAMKREPMTEPKSGYSSTFTVSERRELEAILDRETAEAIAVATQLGEGLVVTRHDAQTFTVTASPEVPPGLIQERDLFS